MFTRVNRPFYTTMRAFGGRLRPRHRGAECSLRCDESGYLTSLHISPPKAQNFWQTFNCENGEMPALSTAVTVGSRPLTAGKVPQAQTISEWLKKQMGAGGTPALIRLSCLAGNPTAVNTAFHA